MAEEVESGGGSVSSGSGGSAGTASGVTSGTASAALLAAASASEAAASSAATEPAGQPAGDTSAAASTGGGAPAAAEQPKPTDSQPAQPREVGGRNPELEARFQSVSRNTFTKTMEALGLEGVAYKDLPKAKEEISIALGLLRALRQDRKGFYQQLGAELEGTEEFQLPDGELATEDGKARAYSAGQMKQILANFEKVLTNKLLQSGELKPVFDMVRGAQAERQTAEQRAARQKEIGNILTEARTFPHFKDNEQLVANEIVAIRDAIGPEGVRRMGLGAVTLLAYNRMLQKHVFPGIESAAEGRVREDLKKKAAAQGSQAPSGTTASSGPKSTPKNVTQLAERMAQMEQEMTSAG